ncbi:MAG: hypothetical protein V3T30_03900 [Thermodesulfobacteriota bacterium]
MGTTRCSCCGRELHDGSLKYVVELRSFADFDGYLEEFKGDIEEGINELLDAVENMDMESLEEDVYQVQIYILCKGCRDRFSSDPFQTGTSILEFEESKGTVH